MWLEERSLTEAITECLRQDGYLSSVKDLKERLKREYGLDIKPWRLLGLIHREMNMKYKRVQAITWLGNTPKNLILRQQFGMAFLKLDLSQKTVINVDETWLGMSDFRKMSWSAAGKSNSVPKKQIQPRVSMITGLDSHGEVYLALT